MREKIKVFVEQDRRVTVFQIAKEMGISTERVNYVLHKKLGLSKLSARWVPRLLTASQKAKRVACCRNLLQLWNEDPENFHTKIVTGDESWIHHYDPESKIQSMQWIPKGGSGPIKAKSSRSAGKVLATIFWDSKGVLMEDYIPTGSTMNSKH